MATDHDTVSPIEHDETANLRLALMERWRESCGRVAERFGRRSDIPFYSSARSALAGECADDMGKSGRVAEAAVAMLADALMEKDPRGYADSAEAAARELERLVSSIAYADALGRLRAANSTFETRILGEIDGTDPDALPAVPDGLVGPSDTATCTIDILGGSQEDNREVLDTCGAMMMNEDPDIGDFCFITFMLRDGSPSRSRSISGTGSSPADGSDPPAKMKWGGREIRPSHFRCRYRLFALRVFRVRPADSFAEPFRFPGRESDGLG